MEQLLKRAEVAEGSDFKEIMDMNPPFDVQKALVDRAADNGLWAALDVISESKNVHKKIVKEIYMLDKDEIEINFYRAENRKKLKMISDNINSSGKNKNPAPFKKETKVKEKSYWASALGERNEEIIKRRKEGKTARQVFNELKPRYKNLTYYTVRNVLTRANSKERTKSYDDTIKERNAKIIELIQSGIGSVAIAGEVGLSAPRVRKILTDARRADESIKTPSRFLKEKWQEIMALKKEGNSSEEIAQKLGIKKSAVEGQLNKIYKAGLLVSRQGNPNKVIEKMIESPGLTIEEVANELGMTKAAVYSARYNARKKGIMPPEDKIISMLKEGKADKVIEKALGITRSTIYSVKSRALKDGSLNAEEIKINKTAERISIREERHIEGKKIYKPRIDVANKEQRYKRFLEIIFADKHTPKEMESWFDNFKQMEKYCNKTIKKILTQKENQVIEKLCGTGDDYILSSFNKLYPNEKNMQSISDADKDFVFKKDKAGEYQRMTFTSAGIEMGISASEVGQIYTQAASKLKDAINMDNILEEQIKEETRTNKKLGGTPL